MKALTICQPYAELIMRGDKVIENRTWATSYRGPLLIHAGKSRSWLDDGDLTRFPGMPFGAVVGQATLLNCVTLDRLPPSLQANEHANGPWCWLLGSVVRFAEPLAMRGAQGLWEARDQAPWL